MDVFSAKLKSRNLNLKHIFIAWSSACTQNELWAHLQLLAI